MKHTHITKKHLLHMYANCDKCDFHFTVTIASTVTQLRAHVRRHVRDTGHPVIVERAETYKYSLSVIDSHEKKGQGEK